MNELKGWALVDMTSCLALLAAAGMWIASSELGAGRGEVHAPDVSNLSVGVKKAKFRFTEDDIGPVVTAMSNAGIGDFICWINPDTGAFDVVTAFDHKPHLDMKPGSCPNPVNVTQGSALAAATVPAALLGNAFDVTHVDINTVRLSPVILQETGFVELPPVHVSFGDVGSPFEGEACACAALGPDGVLDLAIHFDRQAMIDGFNLQALPNNTSLPMKVTGMVNEGRAIFGTRDCIRILNH